MLMVLEFMTNTLFSGMKWNKRKIVDFYMNSCHEISNDCCEMDKQLLVPRAMTLSTQKNWHNIVERKSFELKTKTNRHSPFPFRLNREQQCKTMHCQIDNFECLTYRRLAQVQICHVHVRNSICVFYDFWEQLPRVTKWRKLCGFDTKDWINKRSKRILFQTITLLRFLLNNFHFFFYRIVDFYTK